MQFCEKISDTFSVEGSGVRVAEQAVDEIAAGWSQSPLTA
jgi:hypothetical protein